MSLKHELTFSRALRAVARWWWFVVLSSLGLLVVAYVVAGRSAATRYEATARLHVVPTVVTYSPVGQPVPATVIPRTIGEVNIEAFYVASAARAALASVGARHLTPEQVLARLQVVPLSPTDVELTYIAAAEDLGRGIVAAYASDYVTEKRALDERAIAQAVQSLRAERRSVRQDLEVAIDPSAAAALTGRLRELNSGIAQLELAADLIPEHIARVGGVEVTTIETGLPRRLAAAGGLVAGLLFGVLTALLINRFDPRIRRASDIDVAGAPVVAVGPGEASDATQRLRSELEVAGLGHDFETVAVTSPTSAETRTHLAFELAQAFAAAGTPTVLVSADLSAAHDDAGSRPVVASGVGPFLEGAVEQLESVAITRNLTWIPKGETTPESQPMFTSEKVTALLSQARRHGRVVVVDAAPLEEPSGLILAATAELTLLVVQRGRTSWSRLAAALEVLERSVRRPVQICFDRSSRRAASRPARTGVSRRVAAATPARH